MVRLASLRTELSLSKDWAKLTSCRVHSRVGERERGGGGKGPRREEGLQSEERDRRIEQQTRIEEAKPERRNYCNKAVDLVIGRELQLHQMATQTQATAHSLPLPRLLIGFKERIFEFETKRTTTGYSRRNWRMVKGVMNLDWWGNVEWRRILSSSSNLHRSYCLSPKFSSLGRCNLLRSEIILRLRILLSDRICLASMLTVVNRSLISVQKDYTEDNESSPVN